MMDIRKTERLQVVDALRGFALAGIVIAHMYEQFTAAPRPVGGWDVIPNLGDHITSGFIWILIFGKFYSLFALLIGNIAHYAVSHQPHAEQKIRQCHVGSTKNRK